MESKCVICNNDLRTTQRKFCSDYCKNKWYYEQNKEQLNANTYYRQTVKYYYRKVKLLKKRNGCCESCGYNKNIAALEFHHKNQNSKNFSLDARHLSNTNWEVILEEFDKCEVLCSICHREKHNPESSLTNLEDKYERLAKEIGLNEAKEKNRCEDCQKEINPKAKKCFECNKISRRKVERPSYEQLMKDINELGYLQTGKKYGVSDNSIRKWKKALENSSQVH